MIHLRPPAAIGPFIALLALVAILTPRAAVSAA